MFARTELFLVPLAVLGGELKVLVRREQGSERQTLPNLALKTQTFQRGSQKQLLSDILLGYSGADVSAWLGSPACCDRIVDCYDRDLLFEESQSVAIVKAVALPEILACEARGTWISPKSLFSGDSALGEDCKLFLREALNLIPRWIRFTSFAFELLPSVFAIQDLRLIVSLLSKQEIDPGNFHRRLKRLDVLSPMVTGQRVHRWEFSWSKSHILGSEGLIP